MGIFVSFTIYSDFMNRWVSPAIYTPATTLHSLDDVKDWTDKDRTTCENDENCAYDTGGHAVIATGWGDYEGKKYWHLKNSWGAEFGVKGFFRMARGSNVAGIEESAVTVVAAGKEGLTSASPS